MKQIRKISNIVAEELEASLSAKGITMEENAFESKVSDIVNMISEAVDSDNSVTEGVLEEGVEVADVYMATEDTVLGDVTVKAGEFVQIDEIDMDDETISVIVYDEEGEVKAEDVEADYDDVEKFAETAEIVDLDDEEDVEEAGFGKQRTMALKKKGFNAKDIKLKAKLAAKKAPGKVNKFTIKNGKIVKKSAEQLANDKKKSKTFGKKMKRFAKKRAKSFKKNFKKFGAKEGFDITSGDMKFAVEEGDILMFEEGTLSVARGGAEVISGIKVSECFIDRCVSEDVVEEVETSEGCKKKGKACETDEGCKTECDTDEPDETDEGCKKKGKADEAALLTFDSSKGFVMVKEGSEVPMGNRVRARAFLRNQGYNVTSDMLDTASEGKVVTL